MTEPSFGRQWPEAAKPRELRDITSLGPPEPPEIREFPQDAHTVAPRGVPTRWARREALEACGAVLHRMGGPALASIGVTSTVRKEGRSTVAVAMAAVQRYAYARKTILLELDLENPSAADRLSVAGHPGVAEIIRGAESLDSCLQPLDNDFDVMVAGDVGEARASLLSGSVAKDLIKELQTRCDVLILDLPPLSPQVLGAQLADLCAAVTLVVRAGAVTARQLRQAADTLAAPPSVVLNGVDPDEPSWIRRLLGITG